MKLLYPDYRFRRVYELTPEWLAERHISVLLLDVDNTLTTHNNPEAARGVPDWIERMTKAGVRLLILSNNKPERVEPFAEKLGMGYIANAAKPLAGGVRRAMERLGVSCREIAIVGDQLFTDVLCANCAGAVSILVEPIELEPFLFFKWKRCMERIVLNGYRRRKRT